MPNPTPRKPRGKHISPEELSELVARVQSLTIPQTAELIQRTELDKFIVRSALYRGAVETSLTVGMFAGLLHGIDVHFAPKKQHDPHAAIGDGEGEDHA